MIHLFALLKMAADTGLWIAGASVLMSLFFPISDLTAGVLLLGLSGGIAHFLSVKKHGLRLLGVIPGLFAFLFCKSMGDFLVVLPAFAYLLLSTVKDLLQSDRNQMYYRFRGRAMLCLAISFLCILRKMNWGFFLCMFILTAWVFLMRLLRHDLSDLSDRKLVGLELGLMAAVCILILALSRDAVFSACIWTIKKVYLILMHPVLKLVITTALLVIRLIDWVLAQFFTGKFEMDFNTMVSESFEAVEDSFPEGTGAGGRSYVLLIIQVAAIAAFLGIAFLIFRKLLSGAAKAVSARESEDSRKDLGMELRSEEVSILDRSPQARVRRSYGSYCRAVARQSRRLTPMDTTRDINLLAKREKDPDAEALRELYFRARYTLSAPLTPGDARRAAALAKNLKNSLQKEKT